MRGRVAIVSRAVSREAKSSRQLTTHAPMGTSSALRSRPCGLLQSYAHPRASATLPSQAQTYRDTTLSISGEQKLTIGTPASRCQAADFDAPPRFCTLPRHARPYPAARAPRPSIRGHGALPALHQRGGRGHFSPDAVTGRAIHFGERLFLFSVVRSDGRASRRPPQTRAGAFRHRADSGRRRGVVRRMFSLEHDLEAGRANSRASLMQSLEAEHRGLRLPCWPTSSKRWSLPCSCSRSHHRGDHFWAARRRTLRRIALSRRSDLFAFPRAETLAALTSKSCARSAFQREGGLHHRGRARSASANSVSARARAEDN